MSDPSYTLWTTLQERYADVHTMLPWRLVGFKYARNSWERWVLK